MGYFNQPEGTGTDWRYFNLLKGQYSRGSWSAAGTFSSKWRQRGEVICWMSYSLVGDGKVKGSLGCSDHELVFRGPSYIKHSVILLRAEDTGSIYKIWGSLDNCIIICQMYQKKRQCKCTKKVKCTIVYNGWNKFSLCINFSFCPFQLQPLILVPRCVSIQSLLRRHILAGNA